MDADGSRKDGKSNADDLGSSDGKGAPPDSPAFGLPFVLNYWKEFDLEKARTTMDEQGLKVAEHQESSTKNRRRLAEATRDFRKASSEEQPKLFVGLLKSYQEEVDNLTKRAKFAESAFLSLYQKLYEAPDPVPALVSAAELAVKMGELSGENRKMRAELDEFRAESSHLKNQQATVRRLEERNRQLEQMMEEKVKETVAMKQQVLAEESQKSLEALKEREEALQEQLRVARESVENMQRLHDMGQSQLFEVKAKSEEERETKQYELNLLTDEVERAQMRLVSLEREKESLLAQLKDAASGDRTAGAGPTPSEVEGSVTLQHSWEAALRAKEAIISELHAELHALETNAASEREGHLAELRRLNASLQEKEDEILGLTSELNTRPSAKQWEDIRKQVKILQAVGYNAVEVEDWEEAASGPGPGVGVQGLRGRPDRGSRGTGIGVSGEMGRLETLLLEKNRRMEHELTQAKVLLSEKAEKAEALAENVKSLEAQVEEQRRLIAKLEEDILRGYSKQPGAEAASPELAGRSADGSLSGLVAGVARLGLGAAASDAAQGAGARTARGLRGDTAKRGAGDADEGRDREGGEDSNSVLVVVCSQRDRFRQRITDLEEELRLSQERCTRLSADVEKLKGENVKLYERMRYIESYATSSTANGDKGMQGANRPRKSAGDVEAVDVEQKYKRMYEEGLNPFAQFSSREKELRYKELGLRDWIALTSGKFFLSNKHARTFVFFYSIALHILVFLSMYKLSHYSHQSVQFHRAAHFATDSWTPSAVVSKGANLVRTVASAVSEHASASTPTEDADSTAGPSSLWNMDYNA